MRQQFLSLLFGSLLLSSPGLATTSILLTEFLTQEESSSISKLLKTQSDKEQPDRESLEYLSKFRILEVETAFYEYLYSQIWNEKPDLETILILLDYIVELGTNASDQHETIRQLTLEALQSNSHKFTPPFLEKIYQVFKFTNDRKTAHPPLKDLTLVNAEKYQQVFEQQGLRSLYDMFMGSYLTMAQVEYLGLALTNNSRAYLLSKTEALEIIVSRKITHPLIYKYLVESLVTRRAQKFELIMTAFLYSYGLTDGEKINSIIHWARAESKILAIYMKVLVAFAKKHPRMITEIKKSRLSHPKLAVQQAKYQNLYLEDWLIKATGKSPCVQQLVNK